MMAIPHIGFILAAYALTAAVMVGMAAMVLTDGRSLRRALDRLDPRRSMVATSRRADGTGDRTR